MHWYYVDCTIGFRLFEGMEVHGYYVDYTLGFW